MTDPEPQVLRHHLAGFIDEKKARKTISALRELHDSDPDACWDITISSEGGQMVASGAIYSELHGHSVRAGGSHFVITRTRGQAASGASLIFQAGDFRLMGPMDTLMLHEPMLSCDEMPLSKINAVVEEFENWIERYARVYTERSSLTTEQFKGFLRGDRDWRMYGDEAMSLGFTDGLG